MSARGACMPASCVQRIMHASCCSLLACLLQPACMPCSPAGRGCRTAARTSRRCTQRSPSRAARSGSRRAGSGSRTCCRSALHYRLQGSSGPVAWRGGRRGLSQRGRGVLMHELGAHVARTHWRRKRRAYAAVDRAGMPELLSIFFARSLPVVVIANSCADLHRVTLSDSCLRAQPLMQHSGLCRSQLRVPAL